jgi:aminopeptidase-like protein
MAFDHAFTFGGVEQLGMFNVKMSSYSNNLFQTPFYMAVCKHLGKRNTFKIVEDFIPLLSQNFSDEISAIFKAVVTEWNLFPHSDRKIIDFISDNSHITNCHNLALQSLK